MDFEQSNIWVFPTYCDIRQKFMVQVSLWLQLLTAVTWKVWKGQIRMTIFVFCGGKGWQFLSFVVDMDVNFCDKNCHPYPLQKTKIVIPIHYKRQKLSSLSTTKDKIDIPIHYKRQKTWLPPSKRGLPYLPPGDVMDSSFGQTLGIHHPYSGFLNTLFINSDNTTQVCQGFPGHMWTLKSDK
jgi:hypothetical protein